MEGHITIPAGCQLCSSHTHIDRHNVMPVITEHVSNWLVVEDLFISVSSLLAVAEVP